MREGKVGLDPPHLLRRQHQQITQGGSSCHLESPPQRNANQINES
jgi:hypothetical protein